MNDKIIGFIKIDYRDKKHKRVKVFCPNELKRILDFKKIHKYYR